MLKKTGILYVVATPIGNLGDMTLRAIETLKSVKRIAAEDTRHSQRLLNHYSISTPSMSLHEHNEVNQTQLLLKMLHAGDDIALISDAGTPLISDPGFVLVREIGSQGIKIVPIPGPSACIAALSVSGLPTDRFVFEGFLPKKQALRHERIVALKYETRTVVIYETPHRLLASLSELITGFGAERKSVLARELTKRFETVYTDNLQGILTRVTENPIQQKGEMVLLIEGRTSEPKSMLEGERVLRILLAKLGASQAASFAAKITGIKKQLLYDLAVELSKEQVSDNKS